MKRRVKERTYGVSGVHAGAVLSPRLMLAVHCITLLGTVYIDQSEPSVRPLPCQTSAEMTQMSLESGFEQTHSLCSLGGRWLPREEGLTGMCELLSVV